MHSHALAAVCIAALAGSALAQPAFTQLPPGNSVQLIGLYVSDDGETCAGFVAGNTNFIWRASSGIELVSGAADSGVLSSIGGMNAAGTKFLFGYRDAATAASPTYPNGVATTALYQDSAFSIIAPPAVAQSCDQSIVSPRDLSSDGSTVLGSAWARCAVAPYAWTAASGWTAWATQDTFPPFGQVGYQSHQVTAVSRHADVASGWYQSGTGYGGRTALVWTNHGTTVSRLDAEPHSVLWGQADAVSANGRFVCGAGVPTELLPSGESPVTGNKFLYRWSAATGVQVLPGKIDTAPGSMRHPNVNFISDDGNMIIGQDAFGGDRDAFIWTPQTGGMKLTDYLLTKGLDLANNYFVTLTSAAGASSNGRYITGQWMDFGGGIGPFVLDLGAPEVLCSPADLGAQGGVSGADGLLDNNDFIVFINKFFAADPAADLGVQGGLPGHDGQFDNNDFISFINLFFAGCNN